LILFATASTLHAQVLTVLHSFSGLADGSGPDAGLTVDGGIFYGTTSGGYQGYEGSVYQLKSAGSGWVLSPLFVVTNDNDQTDGYNLATKPVFGPDGALYGSAFYGGNDDCLGFGCGTIFKLRPRSNFCPSFSCPWNINLLFTFFDTPDQFGGTGAFPGQIIFGPDGNIYGTTQAGGNHSASPCQASGCGTVFQLTHSGGTWSRNILYEFNGTNGLGPKGGVIFDSAGNLYGTTVQGGTNNKGVVFKLSPAQGSWTETVLHSFDGSDGDTPMGGLTMDASGNLFGASEGDITGVGVVFELSRPGVWNYQVLYRFLGFKLPQGGLLLDSSGNIYGTLQSGELIYKLTQMNGTWTYAALHQFTNAECFFPNGGLIMDAQGSLYGTCQGGGDHVAGTIWKFTP
jgi:uncharacterized repeat protein (TIGR03803 family)